MGLYYSLIVQLLNTNLYWKVLLKYMLGLCWQLSVGIFTASAPRPIQSMSHGVRLSPPGNPVYRWI